MNDLPFEWIPGEVVEQAYVEIDGVKYYVTPARYADGTSLSAYHLNRSEYETIKRVNGTILWENPNPTADFAAQTITLNSSDYDIYEVYYYDWTSGKHMKSEKALKGQNTIIDLILYYDNKAFIATREITYVSDTSLSIGRCDSLVDSSAFTHLTPANWCVPVYVIGYKTGLFGGQS
jgi:hypothetical protein